MIKLKKAVARHIAKRVRKSIQHWAKDPLHTQQQVFQYLLKQGRKTEFGRQHDFDKIATYEDFQKAVPIRDYEALLPYIEQTKQGKANILWPGKPLYFCKTSGTTSGTKYIPISKQSMPHHIKGARNTLLCYLAEHPDSNLLDGKMIFLQGSPLLDLINGIPVGRLSGIVANHVPTYLQKNNMPSYATNCIEDWEAKLDAIVVETVPENMTLISGIPPWVQMYFEKLKDATNKETIKEIFPNLELLIFGGVDFQPYQKRMLQLSGTGIRQRQLYPASEGFIAFQDSSDSKGMLLILNGGIFYEFIKSDEFFSEQPTRIHLKDVTLHTDYVLILNTNAGLWGYNLGDTIQFISLDPFRIVVTGRIKHFISAFGEHVIVKEVETALREAIENTPVQVAEFTVAPQVTPLGKELPHHEWFIEFIQPPEDLSAFSQKLDFALQNQNTYYADLIEGNILQTLKITTIQTNGFRKFMEQQGKLGGQNKVPHLSNDRKIVEKLTPLLK